MKKHGVKRLLLLSTLGAGDSAGVMKLVFPIMRLFAKPMYQTIFEDKNRAEEIITATELDWTLVRPPRLTDDPKVGRYQTKPSKGGGGFAKISRADLATFMLDEAEKGSVDSRSPLRLDSVTRLAPWRPSRCWAVPPCPRSRSPYARARLARPPGRPAHAPEHARGPCTRSSRERRVRTCSPAAPATRFVNQVEPEALRRAGVRLILATVWPPPATRPGRSALGEALEQLEQLKAFTRKHPEFILVRDAAEARRELARGRLVLFAAVEGGEGIERVEDVDVLYAAGVRSLTLVHFVDNTLADALDDQFGPQLGGLLNGRDGALTPLGVEAVQRMMQLGILIDVAHASERTLAEVQDSSASASSAPLPGHATRRALGGIPAGHLR
jgi:hypothetical protein